MSDFEIPFDRPPDPPAVKIRYRNGMEVECPVRYLGWITPDGADHPYHGWRVLNEGPYDYREGDDFVSVGGTPPHYIEILGTARRWPEPGRFSRENS